MMGNFFMLWMLCALVLMFMSITTLLKYRNRIILMKISKQVPMRYLSIILIHQPQIMPRDAEMLGSKVLLSRDTYTVWKLCTFVLLVLPTSDTCGKMSVFVGCLLGDSRRSSKPFKRDFCNLIDSSNNKSDLVSSSETLIVRDCNIKVFNNTCSICLEDLLFIEEQFLIACGHAFHLGCFAELALRTACSTCPYCKASLEERVKIFEDDQHVHDPIPEYYGSTIVTALQSEAQDISTLL